MNRSHIFLCFNALLAGGASLSMDIKSQEAEEKDRKKKLFEAVELGNIERAQELLKRRRYGYLMNEITERTGLLRMAAEKGHSEMCQLLIDQKAEINFNCSRKWDRNPLRNAAEHGHKEVCQLLINCNAIVDLKDHLGRTALMRASEVGHRDVCQLLLDNKAQVDVKSKHGSTALMAAGSRDHKEICQLLADAMLKPIKQKQMAAMMLLGMKKFRKAACMNSIDYNVILLIAHHLDQEKQNLFAQINALSAAGAHYLGKYVRHELIMDEKIKQKCSPYF